MIKGKIILNPFGVSQTERQAERMVEEFNKLGVKTEIVKKGWKDNKIEQGRLSEFNNVDFVLFLDKDKYLSKSLLSRGIKMFNSHEAIRVCDDKGETYLALIGQGLNIPKTIFAPLCYRKECEVEEEDLKYIESELHFPVIVKESYGSLGLGVFMAKDLGELRAIAEKTKLKPHLYQEYLPYKFGTDVRVIVIGGKVVTAMERVNKNDFRSNIALGGTGKAITLNKEWKDTAEKVAKILNLDYCGIDLLYGKNGEPYVCEVNSNAFFDGIEKATGVNVAYKYAEYILDKLK